METPKGTCRRCGKSYAGRGMSRHLASCLGEGDRLHLRIQARHSPLWWLNLSVAPTATLAHLDGFLRQIWLECCGHLSAFEVGGLRYEPAIGDAASWYSPPPKPMSVKIGKLLGVGDKFGYQYDFGSTTELAGRVLGRVGGPRTRIVELARNDAPAWVCEAECEQPARWICSCCQAVACAEHGDIEGECPDCGEWWESAQLPLVNSPRTGVCGYTGPDGWG